MHIVSKIITCSVELEDIHRPVERILCRRAKQRTPTEQPSHTLYVY